MAYLPGVVVTVLVADLGDSQYAWCAELRMRAQRGARHQVETDSSVYRFGTATGSFVVANIAAIEDALGHINHTITERVEKRRASHQKIGTTRYHVTTLVHPKSISDVHAKGAASFIELAEAHGHVVRLAAFTSTTKAHRNELAKYITSLIGEEDVEQTELPF